jgi:multiple sugar transport system permease protein
VSNVVTGWPSDAVGGKGRGTVPRAGLRHWWQSPLSRRRVLTAYLCLTPWLIGFVLFIAYPIAASFYYSLTDYPILQSPKWVGGKNYVAMVHDPLFWQSLQVTVTYSLLAVSGSIVIGYAIALLLNQRIAGMPVWRTLFFLPSIVPAIAAAYLWAWIFNPDFGLANGLLEFFQLPTPGWFTSPTWVLPAFIIMTLWAAGGNLIVYLAALQQVPTQLYEAAEIDGAGRWRQLIHVTLPMTSPILLFTFLIGIIASFQVFTAGYVVTNGGPSNASLFYVLYLFRNGWQYFKMGYASALAWVLMLIIMALTLITLWASRRFVYYEHSDQEA